MKIDPKYNISPEMTEYLTTGRCPRCGVRIIDRKHFRNNSHQMQGAVFFLTSEVASGRISKLPPMGWQVLLIPDGQLARFSEDSKRILCLTCGDTWPTCPNNPSDPLVRTSFEEDLNSPRPLSFRTAALPSRDEVVEQWQSHLARGAQPSLPGRKIDLAGCSVTEIKKLGQIEKHLSEERKRYPNNSKTATLTKEVGVSNSITREVMIESGQLKAHNAEAGITLIGFAAIQGQVQNQLNQTYAVTTQSTITISETTTIEIPPQSIIEHVIQWKVISESGLVILGPRLPTASRLAEVPYHIPLRLTYTEEINDVPGTKS